MYVVFCTIWGFKALHGLCQKFSSAADECDALPSLVFPAHYCVIAMNSAHDIPFISFQDQNFGAFLLLFQTVSQ
jgi:hypothetical protein